jgi:hypothetical protein
MNHLSDADLEVVSAFVDGEVVAAPSLTQALATEGGREYLIDLLQLRQAAFGVRTQLRSYLAPQRRPRFRWLVAWSIPTLLTAAFVTGYFVRINQEQRRGEVERASVDQTNVTVRQLEPSPPAPSIVIELEPGVSWFERSQVR